MKLIYFLKKYSTSDRSWIMRQSLVVEAFKVFQGGLIQKLHDDTLSSLSNWLTTI